MRKPLLQFFYFLGFVFLFVFLSISCTTQRGLKIHDDLPPGAKKGFVEFYCFRCMTGFSIYRIEKEKETFLAQIRLGRQRDASVKSPVRLKRLRIAHIPGEYDFEIKLFGFYTPRKKKLFTVKICKDKLTPIQMGFAHAGGGRIYFGFEKATPIPLENHPEILDFLETLLRDPSWQTRWYGVQVAGEFLGQIPSNISWLLEYYAGEEGYKGCLKGIASPIGAAKCSELRAQAKISLEKIKAKQRNEDVIRGG